MTRENYLNKCWIKEVKLGNCMNTMSNIDYKTGKSDKRFNLILLILVSSFLLACVSEKVYSQTTKTWVPSIGGSWTTAGNWNPSGEPSDGDNVVINSLQSAPITNIPDISLGSLIVSGSCNLIGTNGQPRLITVAGTLSVSAGTTLYLGTVSTDNTELTLAAGGTGTIDGTLFIYWNNSAAKTITINGDLTIGQSGLVSGTGTSSTFILSSGATLRIANTEGITTTGSTGAVQTPVRTYSAGANYIYNGTSAQLTGNGLTQNTPANLTVNNGAGVSLSAATTILGMLTMTSGTINLGSYNLTTGSLTGSSNITGSTGSLTLATGSDGTSPAAYPGVISNGGATVSLTKTGSGTLVLSGNNTYTGTTTISGGRLQIASSERIANASNIVLSGGTFSTGSSTGFSETVGTLNLQAASTIALGTGSHTLTFAASNGVTWGTGEVMVTGWTGAWDGTSSGTSGKLFVGSSSAGLTSTQLGKIVFAGPSGALFSSTILGTGEVIPLTVIAYSASTTFSASGSWTVPCGISSITVHAWGGGGGGGGAKGTNVGAGGGGGGAYNKSSWTVNAGDVYTATIGVGGTGGAATPTDGIAGGQTSFSGVAGSLIALPGSGGLSSGGLTGGAGGSGFYIGGTGGTSSSIAPVNGAGGGGGAGSGGNGVNGGNAATGTGGTGTYPGGNGGAFRIDRGDGNPGSIPGGGGGGARTGNNSSEIGGNGGNGKIVIAYYNYVPTITPGTNPAVCQGITSATLTYTSAGCPDQYSLDYDATANTQGFTDVAFTILPASPLTLTIPANAAVGVYNADLRVRNTTSGLNSGPVVIQVTVNPNSWTGATSTDWNTATNWCGGVVPGASAGITIPSGGNQPAISASAQCSTLTISSGASLTIAATGSMTVSGNLTNSGTITINSTIANSGSLIVQGTSSGNVTYNRQMQTTLPNGNFHFFSSAVGGQSVAGFISANTSNLSQIWSFQETDGSWPVVSSGNFVSGKGYNLSQKSGSTGIFIFTGSVVNSTTITATSPYATGYTARSTAADYNTTALWSGTRSWTNYGAGGWNLLGNPFTAALDAAAFLATNAGKFDPSYQALYVYDVLTSVYKYAAASVPGFPSGLTSFGTKIQAGQGFFVLALYDGIVFSFTSSMRVLSSATTFAKSAGSDKSEKADDPWPGLLLKVKHGDFENLTTVVYNADMTPGLDPGYDVGLYSSGSEVELYTNLVEGENVANMTRQALPVIDCDKFIIPVGIFTENGGEMTFSADIIPLTDYKFLLEDRTAGIFTDLSETSYTVNVSPATYGTGQFYIHTSSSILTSIKPPEKKPEIQDLKLWVSDKSLIIKGNVGSRASCEVYDMNGHKILQKTLVESDINSIAMPSGSKGFFIVRVRDGLRINTLKAVIP